MRIVPDYKTTGKDFINVYVSTGGSRISLGWKGHWVKSHAPESVSPWIRQRFTHKPKITDGNVSGVGCTAKHMFIIYLYMM